MTTPIVETRPKMVRYYFASREDDDFFEGPFNSKEEACQNFPANEVEYVRIIVVTAPEGIEVDADLGEEYTDIDEDTLKRTWDFEEPTGG